MNRHPNLIRGFVFVVSLLVVTGSVWAQSSKVAGELAAASGATINGAPAVSGTTVFSNNRVRTARQGAAIVNVGKLGRLELGAESDLTMQFSTANLGGQLHNGRVIISTPMGIAISISTSKGLVTTDGQAAVLTIEADGKQVRVVAHRGEAKLIANGNIERITAGEEIAQDIRSATWQRRRLIDASALTANGLVGISGASQIAQPALANSMQTGNATLTSLFNTGIKLSLTRLTSGAGRDPEQFFDTTITCRDNDSIFCRKRSGVRP